MFLNAPWKLFYVNLPFEWHFVTFWKLIRSHAVTPRWLDGAKEFIQSGWSKQHDSCWSLRKLYFSNFLAVSSWILNGSSIECLEKFQPFSLAGVWFGSWVNQISGLKSAWRRSELCLTLLLCNCCYKRSLRNNPRNQTNIFRFNVTLTTPRSQSCIIKSFLEG